MNSSKFFLKSSGVVGGLGALTSSVIALAATGELWQSAHECAVAFGRHEWAETLAVLGPAMSVIFSAIAVRGRMNARTELHTPRWMPGPNRRL